MSMKSTPTSQLISIMQKIKKPSKSSLTLRKHRKVTKRSPEPLLGEALQVLSFQELDSHLLLLPSLKKKQTTV